MARGDIKYVVTADTKKGKAAIKEFDQKVDKLGKTSKTAAGGFKTLAAKVAVGVAAFYGATKALSGMVRWLGESVKGAIDAEKAEKKLEVVLKSTAEAAGLTKDELVDMAKALQAVTTYEDDVIMGAEHLLLTFTNIGKEVFPEALETVLDMSQAMGTDLKGASIQLGKALQDPILGATALRRVGVNLSQSMMEQIKVFVESGNIMGAQKLILAELATEFGGTARAVTETFGGSLIQLKNTWRELQDEVGEAIIHNEEFKDTIQMINQAVRDLIDSRFLDWFTDIAAQAVKSAPMLRSLQESLMLMALIFKEQADAQRGASESMQEWFKHISLNDELQQKLREDIAKVIVVTEDQAEATKTLAERAKEASGRYNDFIERQRDINEIFIQFTTALHENRKYIELVGTDFELLGQGIDWLKVTWEQFLPSFEQGNLDMQLWMSDTLGIWTEAGQKQWEILNTTKEELAELSNFEQVALAEMSASYQGFIGTILGVIEKWAVGEIVKKVMIALPFPINILATAGAIAAVKAIFAGIKSMETGGTIEREGIYHLHAGETVTPASRVSNIYNQTTHGGARAVFNLYITTTRAVNAEQLFRDMKREAKRHGYKL
ncbi:phage tail length tape measure family protein [bacterium]|nr:phage tail length tape measure family protein [bacterium]